MADELDKAFFERADACINLANSQIAASGRAKVSASFLYAAARFNAWLTACGVSSAEELRAARDETVKYFVAQYRAMLTENLDDYVRNFERYLGTPGKQGKT